MNKKTNKFSLNLFCSLMLLAFIPFLYTLVRTNLIANSQVADGLSIAGHIEWFDLINETIQAFLSMTGMPVFCGESPHRRSYRRTLKRLPRFIS